MRHLSPYFKFSLLLATLTLLFGLLAHNPIVTPKSLVEDDPGDELIWGTFKCGPPPTPPPLPPPPQVEEAFTISTEPPLFPGCEHLPSFAEKKQCADRKMLEFIHGNMRIPAISQQNSVAGTVMVSFVVEKNGTVGNVEILRGIGGGYGEEVVRVINLMNSKGIKFNPCRSGGRATRYRYNIPVKISWE